MLLLLLLLCGADPATQLLLLLCWLLLCCDASSTFIRAELSLGFLHLSYIRTSPSRESCDRITISTAAYSLCPEVWQQRGPPKTRSLDRASFP